MSPSELTSSSGDFPVIIGCRYARITYPEGYDLALPTTQKKMDELKESMRLEGWVAIGETHANGQRWIIMFRCTGL